MTHHEKYDEAKKLIEHGVPVLLTGEKGSGKTTLLMQIAEDLGLEFYSVSMTRQTTLSYLFGFMNVNGDYIESLLYKAATKGGVFNLDEVDAGDANVLLSFNTIENGFLSFPEGIVKVHKDFRLVATANPQDEHDRYRGRSQLDEATLDRFDEIKVRRDENLEQSLVDNDIYRKMTGLRKIIKETNSSVVVSMRDSMRFQVRKNLGMTEGFVFNLVKESELVYRKYKEMLETMPAHADQSECQTLDELVDLVRINAGRDKPYSTNFTVTGIDPAKSPSSFFVDVVRSRNEVDDNWTYIGVSDNGDKTIIGEDTAKEWAKTFGKDFTEYTDYGSSDEPMPWEEVGPKGKRQDPTDRGDIPDSYDDDIPF